MLGGVTDTYTYDNNDKLTSTSSKTYGYDLNGNCTSVKVGAANPTLLTYDIENRVTGITYPAGATNSFVYNGEDLRTKKTDSAGTKTYKTAGSSPASPVLSDGAATYTPGLSERRGTTSSFYHSDALGSTRGITGSTQAATDSTLYDGFGMTVSRTGTNPTPFGFVGASQYQTDSDSGLQLLGHRYYDPSIGRFLSVDPIQDGSNWYAYCDNNPLGETDAEGLQGKGAGEEHHKIHIVEHATKKQAYEAARRESQPTKTGARVPVHHPNDKEGRPPHYHPADKKGKKIENGVHHQYPAKRRGPAVRTDSKYDEQAEIRKAYSGQQRLDPNNPYSSMYSYGPNGEIPIPATTPQQRHAILIGALIGLAIVLAPEVTLPTLAAGAASGAWQPALQLAH